MAAPLLLLLLLGLVVWRVAAGAERQRRLRRLELGQVRLRERLEELERGQRRLEARFAADLADTTAADTDAADTAPAEHPPAQVAPAVSAGSGDVAETLPLPQPGPQPGPQPPPQPPLEPDRGWRRLEKRLIRNGTAILGVAILVAGITFLALPLALRFGPFARFLLVLLAAAALALPALLVGPRSPWRTLALRLRSGGGALLLFACAAGGGLPQLGLQWLDRPAPALALLALGLLVNLWLAAAARRQGLASLHVGVSLVPLLVIPQNGATLALAAGVALAGTLLRLRRPWHRHRLVVSVSFLVFEAAWLLRQAAPLATTTPGSTGLRLLGLAAAVAVFGTGLLLQHARPPAGPRLGAVPLALLLSRWGGLGLALLLLPPTPLLRCGGLALAAAVALGLGLGAGAAGRRDLRRGDELVAQALAMAAILALGPVLAEPLLLLLVLQLETALYLVLGLERRDPLIRRVGWILLNVVNLALLPAGLQAGSGARSVLLLLLAAGLAAGVGVPLRRRSADLPAPRLLGWGSAALAWVGAVACGPEAWRAALALAAIAPLLLLARRRRVAGLAGGAAVATLLTHLVLWGDLLLGAPWPPAALLARLLPLAGLAAVLARLPAGGRLRRLGLDLTGLDASFGAAWLLAPLSPLLPAVAWLLLSLAKLRLTPLLPRRDGEHLLALGLTDLLLFVLAWLTVIRDSEVLLTLGPLALPARLPVQLLGVGVLLAWWLGRPEAGRGGGLWRAVHPWFLEATLLALLVTLRSELPAPWRPAIWALLALGLLGLLGPRLRHRFAPRLALHAVLLHWLGSASLLLLLSTAPSVSPLWIEQPRQVGLVTLALQAAFLAASRRRLDPGLLRHPGGPAWLARIGARLARQRQRWLGYPFFLAVAGYLALRYDRSLLTLLWALEALGIYGLGGLLRDRQFRRLALLALGACLLRLVAVDMAQADLVLRGAVFIGVGASMLAMNALASRFRDRFD